MVGAKKRMTGFGKDVFWQGLNLIMYISYPSKYITGTHVGEGLVCVRV